jgi:hypothetical protein
MDNTNQHRIGCFLGNKEGGNNGSRTKIIDPNAFYGEKNSSRNIPVRLEDLNISVKLTTSKRGRTTILTDEETGGVVVKEQKAATINFFDGSDINGKKVLTTKYTELTTIFEEGIYNNETFGITNIDIDFNSSHTPTVKIDFIDVRGSSIFQNEGQLSDESENKYSSFFEFPYPLFELEIKGYYGQPVTYCLHMLKFNSKFNSQTGNFEVSCEFIGYTFAMLSDMLLGVLKAIPYTKIGGEKFEKYNQNRNPKILNLVELKNRISLIEESIKKAALETEEAKDINTFKPALEILNNLEAAINNFGLEFTTNESNSTSTNTITVYDFVIMNNTSFSKPQQERYSALDKTVKDLIVKYNELNINGANINEVDLITPIILNKLTKKSLEPTSTLTISEDPKLKDKTALESFKKELLNYLNTNYTKINSDYIFRAMDLRSRFKIIKDQKDIIEKSLKDANKELANKIKNTAIETLGFSPTARNMVEVITNLIEIFMETVFEVSKKAETLEVRKELFSEVFTGKKENSDYNEKDNNFYPWPLYSEKETQKDSYIEKYLGTNSIIKNRISDVPELEFIDDLLQGFLTAAREQERLDQLNAGEQNLFFPVNLLDTKLFNEKAGNPYAIKELQNPEQIKRLMILRGMTFLGYTNNQDYLTSEQIKQMALIEANTMLSAVINPTLKVSLKNLNVDDLVKTFGNVDGGDRNLLEYKDGKYYYKYYFEYEIGKTKVLPINSDLNGYQSTALGNPVVRNSLEYLSDTDKILFLTNYSSKVNLSKSVNQNVKQDDYGVYVKMFTPSEYTTTLTLIDTSIDTKSVIDLASLKEGNIANAGFNSFGGIYGIQDFTTINFGNEAPENTPSMYVFYKNDSNDKNSLAYSRQGTSSIEGLSNSNDRNSRYDFDLKKQSITLPNSYKDFRTNEAGKLLHLGSSTRFRANEINTAPDTVVYPYIEQRYSSSDTSSFSLFGSKWYYLQKNANCTYQDGTVFNAEKYAKALLFLNTLPFNISNDNYDPFGKLEIRHLFDIKGGFVHAPRLWAAYVGAVLWWLSEDDPLVIDNEIIGGGRGIKDPLVWQKTCASGNTFNIPKKGDYFPKVLDINIKVEDDSVIRALPEQVRNEFKKVFFDFVNGDSDYISWQSIYSTLEITNQSPTQFCGFLDKMRYRTIQTTPNGQPGNLQLTNNSTVYYYRPSDITANTINYDNYNIIATLPEGVASYNNASVDRNCFLLELNGGSEAGKNLVTAINEEIIIGNTGYGIWETIASAGDEGSNQNTGNVNDYDILRRPIFVKEDIFKEYFGAYISAVTESTSSLTLTNQAENELNKVFGSNNKDEIKLMLYRHCKNIYDKWLGGITNEGNIIFQCGDSTRDGSNRKTTDKAVANKYGYDNPRLIDSFRFVTRSFKDIGDELFINPIPIGDLIADEPNTSAYNVISTLLIDNKFEFMSLPTFINYRDDSMLESVFTPFQYGESITTCGPTFVCVYTGQKSNRLELKTGKYPNDGFDLRCGNDGPDTSIPSDFNEPLNDYEEPVPVFVVNYSQQNQNIFKDISLDQSEFTETEESLKIVQDISTKGFENNPSIGGQNMYNIYAVRSYSAEIEMLGNAMIQPMMYFQLNNIPMFHGAYMIIRTRHNIKPNHMTTWFTGTRIRAIESPIIDVAEAYMSLIETLDLSNAGSASSPVVSGSYPPIVKTLIDNGATNGNVEVGNIKLKTVDEISGVKQNVPAERRKMISEAVVALSEMLKDFVTFAKGASYPSVDGRYIAINSLYRSYDYQKQLYDKSKKDGSVATPGTSNHSWGLAVDFSFLAQKTGTYFTKGSWTPISTASNKEGFNLEYNPSLKWFLDNGYKYGFIIPQTLRDGSSIDEYWHFEYHGTSAKCLYSKLPKTYTYTAKIDGNYKSVVKNPKGVDNKDAVYTDCEFKLVKTGDGTSSNIKNTGKQIDSKLIYDELKKQLGYPDEAIAAIMGNMYQESRFIVSSTNKKDGGYGLVQWTNDRKETFLNYISNNNLDSTSYVDQIKFLTNELNGTFKYTGMNLKKNKNVDNSTEIFYVTYEGGSLGTISFTETKVQARLNQLIAADNTFSKRTNYANQFINMIKNKKFSLPT